MEPNWIQQRAYLSPNRIGLQFHSLKWTFKEIEERASKIAKQLASFSIKPHDRVAILSPTCPQLVFFIYGCMQAQVEIVLLNIRLTSEELMYQIQDADVKAVLYHKDEEHKLTQCHHKISMDDVQTSVEQPIEISSNWDIQQTISIMYTSGTTGYPKGVRQTLRNHQASALNSVLNLGMSSSDTWLCMVPIFHISGFSMLMKSLLYGNTVMLYEKFDVENSVHHIVEGTATHMSVVGVTLGRIIDYMERNSLMAHPNFKLLLAGGSSIPTDYLKRAQKLSLAVAQTYGMTETASQTATLSSEDAFTKVGSAGKPLFFNEIKIQGADGCGIEGEILIRGPHVTPGYIGRFAHKQSIIDGWLHSGDIGYLDEDGYLYVVDRRSDLIISGGENIYPAEIENILLSHPAILEAGVCGIENVKWGQVPAAFIVVSKNISEQEVIDFCKINLAAYKCPKHVYFVDSLPRNSSNKLLRRKLKELI